MSVPTENKTKKKSLALETNEDGTHEIGVEFGTLHHGSKIQEYFGHLV